MDNPLAIFTFAYCRTRREELRNATNPFSLFLSTSFRLCLATSDEEKFAREPKEFYILKTLPNILSNDDKFYILEGLLKYRERLNITEDKLNNPKFIKQSNNPTYWSQTFAFELVDIYK